jgi:hypothetical protein
VALVKALHAPRQQSGGLTNVDGISLWKNKNYKKHKKHKYNTR